MKTNILCFFAIFPVIGIVLSQISNNLDLLELIQVQYLDNKLQENGWNLPNLKEKISVMKSVAIKLETVFKEKCEKEGAGDAFTSMKNQGQDLWNYLIDKLKSLKIEEELEEAKKTGSMDEVFAKYCNRWPEFYGYIENMTVTARTCMIKREQRALNKSLDIVKNVKKFMCFNNGDRLALAVSEGSVECVKKQQEGLKVCINSTIGDQFPKPDQFSPSILPAFLFMDGDCQDFDEIRQCIEIELEKCKSSTPANIIDSLFKFLRKEISCPPTNSAYSIAESILITLSMFLLVRFP